MIMDNEQSLALEKRMQLVGDVNFEIERLGIEKIKECFQLVRNGENL